MDAKYEKTKFEKYKDELIYDLTYLTIDERISYIKFHIKYNNDLANSSKIFEKTSKKRNIFLNILIRKEKINKLLNEK